MPETVALPQAADLDDKQAGHCGQADQTSIAYFERLRAPGSIHIACRIGDRQKLFRASFETLFDVAKDSLPIAVGLTMHMYVLSAIASYPLSRFNPAYHARKHLLARIADEKVIVANTGGARTHQDDRSLVACPVDGGYRLTGSGGLMSLGHVADWILVEARLDGENTGLCIVDLKDGSGVSLGPPVFGDTMRDTGTCEVVFDGCFVPDSRVFRNGEGGRRDAVDAFQRAWFQALVSAAYLGAAEQALHEGARIAEAVITKTGAPLPELDGFRVEMGQLYMRLRIARSLCHSAGHAIAAFVPDDPERLRELREAAALAKYASTHAAEECVFALRRYLGTRALRSRYISRVMKEVVYGKLHPMSDFDMERYFADAFLRKVRHGRAAPAASA
jgi:alkylation response protein AidB-like acyl-CoA dehydrogenase